MPRPSREDELGEKDPRWDQELQWSELQKTVPTTLIGRTGNRTYSAMAGLAHPNRSRVPSGKLGGILYADMTALCSRLEVGRVELTDILLCPKTGSRLRFDGDSVVRVPGSDVTYPVVDGIVDFCPDVKDKISKAYDVSPSGYDAYMTYATSPGMLAKMLDRLVWGFSGDGGITDEVLSHIPADFDGILLDVPVGTGLFTCSRYAGIPNATILAIDYSMGMLQKARMRFLEHGVSNVHLFRADVAKLPVRGDAVDIVLSMAGLHAFADKQRAIKEMRRVLREQGTLLADSYVRGARRRTDWIVKHLLARRGFFTPPFFHADEIASELEGFTIRQQGSFESCAWFEAVKNELAESKR